MPAPSGCKRSAPLPVSHSRDITIISSQFARRYFNTTTYSRFRTGALFMRIDLRVAANTATKEVALKHRGTPDHEVLTNRPATAANDNEESDWSLFPFPDDWHATS